MDILKMLAELRERDAAEQQATMVMDRIAAGQGKPRGRPPGLGWRQLQRRRGTPKANKNRLKGSLNEESIAMRSI
jgi:hypothetical protein